MNYYKLLIKKTLKNRINLIPLVILLLGILGFYLINISDGSLEYTNKVTEQYNQAKELEDYYLRELNSETDYSEKDTRAFEEALKDISEQKKWNEQILDSAAQGDWSKALNLSINIFNRQIEVHEASGRDLFPAEYLVYLEQEIKLYEELVSLNYEPDTVGQERFGYNYVFRVMDSVFPFLFVLIVSVLLTEVFLNTYKKGINIESLIPGDFFTINMKKTGYGILLSICIYVFSLFFSFLLASVMNGSGSIQYPILLHSSITPETIPVWIVILKVFSLQVLSIITIVLLILILSFLTKNRLATMLLSIIITIGSVMTFKTLDTFHSIIHYNPFAYFLSGDAVTGLLALETSNSNITFGNGIMSLSILVILLLIMVYFLSRLEEKR